MCATMSGSHEIFRGFPGSLYKGSDVLDPRRYSEIISLSQNLNHMHRVCSSSIHRFWGLACRRGTSQAYALLKIWFVLNTS